MLHFFAEMSLSKTLQEPLALYWRNPENRIKHRWVNHPDCPNRNGDVTGNLTPEFLHFPQCFLLNQIIVSQFVHIFAIISEFATEMEEPKICISGKEFTPTWIFFLTRLGLQVYFKVMSEVTQNVSVRNLNQNTKLKIFIHLLKIPPYVSCYNRYLKLRASVPQSVW